MDRENVIKAMQHCIGDNCNGDKWSECEYSGHGCIDALLEDAIALLKAQEPVKPILARGWYWCVGVGCRNSLTPALDDDSPAYKPNYCEKCGRTVKWG